MKNIRRSIVFVVILAVVLSGCAFGGAKRIAKSEALQIALTDAGLTKHLSFAMCRWTCFVKDHAEGVPMEVIRDKMGVSQVQWRDIYNKIQILLPVYKGESEKES